jgi:hypothetical protein
LHCRSVESSDDTGNKRKIETSQYSDAGKETNTGYFTDSKVADESDEDSRPKRYKRLGEESKAATPLPDQRLDTIKTTSGCFFKQADHRSSSENSGDSGASPCRGRNDLLTMQKENVQPMSVSSEPLAASCKLQDYVHVRARRGQATDSHSLAERVRTKNLPSQQEACKSLTPAANLATYSTLLTIIAVVLSLLTRLPGSSCLLLLLLLLLLLQTAGSKGEDK